MALSRRASIQPLEEREAGLRPGKPIKDKKQISFADHESRIMKHKGDFEYVYNVQISTARMHQDRREMALLNHQGASHLIAAGQHDVVAVDDGVHGLLQVGHGLLIVHPRPQLLHLRLAQVPLIPEHFEVGGQAGLESLVLAL